MPREAKEKVAPRPAAVCHIKTFGMHSLSVFLFSQTVEK